MLFVLSVTHYAAFLTELVPARVMRAQMENGQDVVFSAICARNDLFAAPQVRPKRFYCFSLFKE